MEVISLNGVAATVAQNSRFGNIAFDITVNDNGTQKSVKLFGDVERTDEFRPQYRANVGNLSTTLNEETTIVRNIYPSDTPFYKSAIYKRSKTIRDNTTYDFQNITTHKLSNDLVDIIRVENTLYALEQKNSYGRYSLSDDIYNYISSQNTALFPTANKISTDIYNRQLISADIITDNVDDLAADAVSVRLENIEYNMLFEIPGNIYNDYGSGNIAANTYKGKNAFDSTYDMSHSDENVLEHARDYKHIGNCVNQVYLTYTDNINYASKSSSAKEADGLYGTDFDKVEILGSINRFANLNGHKANLYSIVINTDLFKKITNNRQKIVDNIKTEIQHNVQKIVEKLAPVQTQLLSVVVNEI